jgi:hypothetical protein
MDLVVTRGNGPNGGELHGLDGPGGDLQLEERALTRNVSKSHKEVEEPQERTCMATVTCGWQKAASASVELGC